MKATLAWLSLVGALSFGSTPATAADVKANWDQHCVACHGGDGKGQTKAGRKAQVKDLTDPKYRKTLEDDKMFKAVKEGMKEGGKEKMKPFGDKLSDEEIKALIVLIKGLK